MTRTERELTEHEAYGLLLLISLIWAGNFMAGKLALEVVGPITLTALRAVLASGVLLWYVRWSYQVWPVATRADLRTFVILATSGLVCNTTLWYYGLHLTLAINAAIVGASGPIFVALLSAVWLRERLSWVNVAGIAVSWGGVVLTITRGSLRALLDLDLNPGDFVILAGQSVWAVYSVYARQVARRFQPTVVATGTYLVAAVILAPLALLERPWRVLPAVTFPTVLAILYAAVLVTISHVWFFWGARVVRAAVSALTVNLIPFEVLAFSWLFQHEPVTWIHVVGALVVILGAGLATRKPPASPPEPPTPALPLGRRQGEGGPTRAMPPG